MTRLRVMWRVLRGRPVGYRLSIGAFAESDTPDAILVECVVGRALTILGVADVCAHAYNHYERTLARFG